MYKYMVHYKLDGKEYTLPTNDFNHAVSVAYLYDGWFYAGGCKIDSDECYRIFMERDTDFKYSR